MKQFMLMLPPTVVANVAVVEEKPVREMVVTLIMPAEYVTSGDVGPVLSLEKLKKMTNSPATTAEEIVLNGALMK